MYNCPQLRTVGLPNMRRSVSQTYVVVSCGGIKWQSWRVIYILIIRVTILNCGP